MRILNWTEPREPILAAAAECLRNGGLVVFPTDTLYGLGAAAANDEAVKRLYEAKKRPPENPLPILIADMQGAAAVAEEVGPLALRLGNRYWPGPLTIVLKRSARFRSIALAGGDSVALRVPDHAVPRELIRALGEPITGTSANLSGQPSPRAAAEVAAQLAASVDIVIDAGPCPVGKESTVVDLTGERPRLLREGAIGRRELEAVIGMKLEDG